MPINAGRVLYEDDSLLAIHKLPGELTVAGKGEMGKLPLLDFLRKDYPGLKPLNRLDFDTSGVVLFARKKEVLAAVLEGKFAGWTKIYRTIVHGRIPRDSGTIQRALPSRGDGHLVDAETAYKILERFEDCMYVEASIVHGRHHQIRRHFAAIHHALVMDPLYGDRVLNAKFQKRYGYRRFFLHAIAVDFPHPVTGARVHVESPLPPAFAQAFERLRRGGERQ